MKKNTRKMNKRDNAYSTCCHDCTKLLQSSNGTNTQEC